MGLVARLGLNAALELGALLRARRARSTRSTRAEWPEWIGRLALRVRSRRDIVDDELSASGVAEDGVAACRARPVLREVLRRRRSRDETVDVAYVGGMEAIPRRRHLGQAVRKAPRIEAATLGPSCTKGAGWPTDLPVVSANADVDSQTATS